MLHDETMTSRAPRVLLLYLQTTGAGHKSAAEAVAAALRERAPGATTHTVNIADYMADTVRLTYHRIRALLLREAPHVLGQLYQWTDGRRSQGNVLDRVVHGAERAAFRRLLRELAASHWDAVVHTHFFPPTVLGKFRQRSSDPLPEVLVTTDFMTHRVWAQPACARTFVATEEALEYLAYLGVPRSRLQLSGIPIHPQFARQRLGPDAFAEQTARRAAELAHGELPRITLMTTGFESAFAAHLLQHVLDVERPLSVLTIAGSSDERRRALEAVGAPRRHRLERLGQTDHVPAILERSDLVIGKAGGLTSSESLACGCPCIIVNPTPDQEVQNTAWLLERGAATMGHHAPLVRAEIEGLFATPERWFALRAAAYRLGRPHAAFDVADQVLELIGKRRRRGDLAPESAARPAQTVAA